jgi:hypothetical protein
MTYHHANHATAWTERTAAQDYPAAGDGLDDIEHHARRTLGFNNPHTSLGVAGRVVHCAAMLFPVLAAELISNAETYKKTVRIGAVGTTVLYEAIYTFQEAERKRRQEAKLAECREHSR